MTPAAINAPPIIAAVIAITPSVSPWLAPSGFKTAKPNSFPPNTSTWTEEAKLREQQLEEEKKQ